MELNISNCNNIESGSFDLKEGALNLKYAINGTGKSTIAKTISAFVNNSTEEKNRLKPFKYTNNLGESEPYLDGYEGIKSVMVFDEAYVESFVYQNDELIKDSFDIFIRTPDYEERLCEIDELLKGINNTFKDNVELEELIIVLGQFIDGFGKVKSGYSASSAIAKGLGKGNKLENIPKGLEVYEPYLRDESINVKWVKWQLDGKGYLEIADQCPYCTSGIEEKRETILKVGKEYDVKGIEHLNKMLDVFNRLKECFSDDTQKRIDEITRNISGITEAQQNLLGEIKKQVEVMLNQLNRLKWINFHTLKNSETIADELKSYRIDISYYSHLDSNFVNEKVDSLNEVLDELLKKAGVLQGEIAKQKKLIKSTIEKNKTEINEFLYYAGYSYTVDIQEKGGNSANYRLVLKHNDNVDCVSDVDNHLSFGERNAFALVLFMYGALKVNPDLIVLDDPISSFDGNKKFAIINMLFMGVTSFRNRTVLMLTHEFGSVIDIVYNMPHNFSPAPKATFLTTNNGCLVEKNIFKSNILPFSEIAKNNLTSDIDRLNKLVYLRRLFEVMGNKSFEWQLVSNVLKGREQPIIKENNNERFMSCDEVATATIEIVKYIPEFSYSTDAARAMDFVLLKSIYQECSSNYDKLQLFRIAIKENSDNGVVKKFVNEIFHVENDYLFQLDPREYDTIPQYIINECDDLLSMY